MKKKNLSMILAVALSVGMMLTGCGSKSENVIVDVESTQETQTEVADPENQPLVDEEPTAENTESATEDNTVEVVVKEDDTVVAEEQLEVSDYLAESGITITPQGTMTIPVSYYDSDSVFDKTVEVTVEAIPSDEAGYVDTVLTTKWDVATTSSAFVYNFNAYDRYSGYSLTSPSEKVTFLSEGGTHENTYVVEVNGVQYDCSYTDVWDTSDSSTWVGIFTIHHPAEYDGVVFRVGKQTASMQAFEDSLDNTSARRFADYPELIEDHCFFTATDK